MSPMLPFTGHNIALPDGTQTCPGTPLIAGNGITLAALRLLALCCEPGARVADLGCLEGGYAVALAQAGYQVTGVEARAANFTRARWAGKHFGDLKLSFALDDARHLADYGTFDAVFCAGLLYHLDKPDEFLRMLGRVTTRLLILQTHVSQRPEMVHERRRGHWHPDNPGDGDPWGSHLNTRSFWMAGTDLLAAVRDAGFETVLSVHDYLEDIAAGPQGDATPANPCGGADRVMVAGIKP